MITFLVRHLVESSLFAAVSLFLIGRLQRGSAATRYSILLAVVAKFVIPLEWLMGFGEGLRNLFPAAKISVAVFFPVLAGFPAATTIEADGSHALADGVAVLWLMVAAILLASWLRRLYAELPKRRGDCLDELELLQRMKQRISVERTVRVVTSDEATEPRLAGVVRPVILLPAGLLDRLTPSELEGVLLHELAHVKRWDNLTRSLVRVVACIFWFHPLLWWLERRLSAECELACDELVLTAGVSPQTYVDGILKVCQLYLQRPIAGVSGVGSSNLKQRMECIMSGRRLNRNFSSAIIAGALLLGAFGAVSVAMGFLTSKPLHAQAPVVAANEGAFCFAGKSYAEGTVIHPEGQPILQVCRVVNGQVRWINTTEELRDHNRAVIEVPNPPPVTSCNQTAPQGKLCTCDDKTFSPGSVVGVKGALLVCPATGGLWQAFDGNHDRKPYPPLAVVAK